MKKILFGLSIVILLTSCVINVPNEKKPKVIYQNADEVEKWEGDITTLPTDENDENPKRP